MYLQFDNYEHMTADHGVNLSNPKKKQKQSTTTDSLITQ